MEYFKDIDVKFALLILEEKRTEVSKQMKSG